MSRPKPAFMSVPVIVLTDSRRPGDPYTARLLRRLRSLPGLDVEEIPAAGPLEARHRGAVLRGRSLDEFVNRAERLLGGPDAVLRRRADDNLRRVFG